MEFAAEVTYPVSETVSSGVLFTSSELFSIPINILIGYLVNRNTEMYIV